MAFLPILLTVAGTAMTMVGQYQQSQAQAQTAEHNAAVAKSQADQYRKVGIFEQEQIAAAGKLEEAKLRRQKRRMTGTQRAAYAASGVSLEGSPLEVMADTASQFELDIAVNKYGTKRDIAISKYKTGVAVRRYGYEAGYQNYLSGEYKKAGYTEIGSTLLTSGLSIKSKYGKG